MASLKGDNLVVFDYLAASEIWYDKTGVSEGSGLIRGVASLEGDNLVVFYHLTASEIWYDKTGVSEGSGLIRGGLL